MRPTQVVPIIVAAGAVLAGCGAAADMQDTAPAPTPGHPVYEAFIRPDPAAGTLSADWRIRFIADERTAASVTFLIADGMNIERVAGPAVRAHRTEPFPPVPVWKQLVVELDSTVQAGTEVALEIAYSGAPVFPPSGINSLTTEWIELSVDSGWLPLFSTFDQQWTGTLRIALPESWVVVTSGSVEYADGAHVVRNTIPQLDVAFSAAPSLEQIAASGFTIYHRGADSAVVAAAFDAAQACAAYLNERYGAESPMRDVRLVLVDRATSAYSRKNYITLSHFDPQDRVSTNHLICHELAHTWSWGADPMGPDHWLTEGFAEYVAARFVRHRFGPETFDSLIALWDEVSRTAGPVWTPELTGRGDEVLLYRRAPVALASVERQIGTEAFDRFLERYMAGRARTTPDLLRELEAVAGAEAAAALRAELGRGPVARGR